MVVGPSSLVDSPNRACGVGVLTVLYQGAYSWYARSARGTLIDKNAYLVTPTLVSPTRNRRSKTETYVASVNFVHFFKFSVPDGSRAGRAELAELTEPAEVPEPAERAARAQTLKNTIEN